MTLPLEHHVRLFAYGVVVLIVTACSSDTTPTGTKSPTPTSFDTLLTNGSIPSSGGTLTVNKPGDPLNGFSLTVPSGAFSSALSVTIGSSSNKNLPAATGVTPASPLVHIVTSVGGYAKSAIKIKVPVTVPTNSFPIVVAYDSATKTMEPMTTIAYDGTSVTAVTGHLSQASALTASATRASGRSRPMSVGAASGTQPDSLKMTFGVWVIDAATLSKDWDTQFRPGVNDWEMPAYPTEWSPNGILLGVAATELWYFNTRAAAIPLNGRFPIVKNAPLSDRTGFHWASVIDNMVGNQFNSYASSAYNDLSQPSGRDQMQFNLIRASFAIAALNGGPPLPVFVDLQNPAIQGYYYLVAYRATGNKIYVADPISPGDSTLFMQIDSGGMQPYHNPAYQQGVSLTRPLMTVLGVAIPLGPLAGSYADALAGIVGNDVFPAAGFYSWSGQLYDTMYVVDSLRLWAQCATCQYGLASTLSPAPSGNVVSSFNVYQMSGGLVTDSLGRLGANGLLATSTNFAAGSQYTFGVPLASPDAASLPSLNGGLGRWLDWHQYTITNLQGTITLPSGDILENNADTLQVAFQPNLLPANVAYQWTFGDSTPTVTVQNNPAVQHSFAKGGTLKTTVKVIDNRNNQVIARVDTTLNTVNVELWQIQSLTYLYTLVNGVQKQASDSGVPKDTLAIPIQAGTVPTLIALNGPPFPNANYPMAGFGLASPPDSAQEWAQVQPLALAISGPYPPIDIYAYTNTGTATSGTITGQAIISSANGVTNGGHTVSLIKNGSKLSGYIKLQGTGLIKHQTTTVIVVDSVVATRVP